MTSLLQIDNKSQMLRDRALQLYNTFNSRYLSGAILSQTQYLYEIYQALDKFYGSIGKPTFQVRYAFGPPSSDDYNTMLTEIQNDVAVLYSESAQLGDTLMNSFRRAEVDRQALSNRLSKVEDTLQTIQNQFSQNEYEVTFRDSFIDQTLFDPSMVQTTPANISSGDGILTLATSTAKSALSNVTVSVLDGNGFPGNTHQIRYISGQMQFLGDNSLHIDLTSLLDASEDTWFEYEVFQVPDDVLAQTNNLGFAYQEQVSWIMQSDNTLRLTVQIELPAVQNINWISLNPFIPSDNGAMPAYLKSVQITDDKNGVTELIEGDGYLFSDDVVYLFATQPCKRVQFYFEQPFAYTTDIGHLSFHQMNSVENNYFDASTTQSGELVSGTYPSITNLGLSYDGQTQTVVPPSQLQTQPVADIELKKQNLFTVPATSTGVSAQFEDLKANRFMIGIRDIAVSNYEFVETSEYDSVVFTTSFPIEAITLTADEEIPDVFPAGSWITYSISIDNGKNWFPIAPRGTVTTGAQNLYLINSNTPKASRIPQFGYIDTLDTVNTVRLKITLSRPTNIPNATCYTPIVKEYRLNVTMQGGNAQ